MLVRLLNDVEAQYEAARVLLVSLAQRQAQFHYFEAMLAGGLALGVVALLLAGVAPDLPRTDTHAVDIVAGCILGGSLGAIFSVLARMHSGRLMLVADAGGKMLRLLGAVRPVVGAVAGVALFLFIDGEAFGILKKPEAGARDYSYYAAVAFLAGFSERWFQGMLVAQEGASSEAEQQLPPQGPMEQPKGDDVHVPPPAPARPDEAEADAQVLPPDVVSDVEGDAKTGGSAPDHTGPPGGEVEPEQGPADRS